MKKKKLFILIPMFLVFVSGVLLFVKRKTYISENTEIQKNGIKTEKNSNVINDKLEREKPVFNRTEIEKPGENNKSASNLKIEDNNSKQYELKRKKSRKNTVSPIPLSKNPPNTEVLITKQAPKITMPDSSNSKSNQVSYFIEFYQKDSNTIWIKRKISNETIDSQSKAVVSEQKDVIYEVYHSTNHNTKGDKK